MTKERKFKRDYAKELLNIARNDLIAAQTLMTNPKVRIETVFFQLQQVVEKSLKAVLVAKEKMVPLVHDIALIIDRLEEKPPYSEELTEFSEFATIRRYEEGSFEISRQELAAAIEIVAKTLAYCEKQII